MSPNTPGLHNQGTSWRRWPRHKQAKGWVIERAPRFGLSPKETDLVRRRSHSDGDPRLGPSLKGQLPRSWDPPCSPSGRTRGSTARGPFFRGVLHPMPTSGRCAWTLSRIPQGPIVVDAQRPPRESSQTSRSNELCTSHFPLWADLGGDGVHRSRRIGVHSTVACSSVITDPSICSNLEPSCARFAQRSP